VTQTFPLRIILENPPPGVDFGLQKGHGSRYETIQTQRSGTDNLTFEFDITIKTRPDANPDFSGEYVQGPRGNRFIYIDIGTYAGQADTPWSRRLKIPLSNIIMETLQNMVADPSLVLETRVPGTGKDGGPNCATVKSFNGWAMISRYSGAS